MTRIAWRRVSDLEPGDRLVRLATYGLRHNRRTLATLGRNLAIEHDNGGVWAIVTDTVSDASASIVHCRMFGTGHEMSHCWRHDVRLPVVLADDVRGLPNDLDPDAPPSHIVDWD